MENKKTHILVTGAAGFIGFHFIQKLLAENVTVTGIDNVNDYYDTTLKLDRLHQLGFEPEDIRDHVCNTFPIISQTFPQLQFYRADLKDREVVTAIFEQKQPDYVVHFAAQAGVRYSLDNPSAYIDSNINGFFSILDNCRLHHVKHLVFASSSSVYGANEKMPFTEQDNVDHPVSLYAATKKSNELMAHSYSHLYKLPTTGLRFFTVYGPWGRPDMAYFSFTHKILAGLPIEVFNHGDMKRDFTYIDDIIAGVYQLMLKIPTRNDQWDGSHPDPATSRAPYRIFNIGNHQPVELLYFIELLEQHLHKKAKKILLPFQKGDVKETYADIDLLNKYIGFTPTTPIETGIAKFVHWYQNYYAQS